MAAECLNFTFFQLLNMRRYRLALFAFLTATYSLFTPAFAQQTAVYTQPISDFKNAADLLAKEKYGAAMLIYERLAITPSDKDQGIRSTSAYYSALCAAKLFHDDAMYRMSKFTRDYPESSNLNAANYELAKLQYNAKAYKDAIASFNQVDVFELTADELAEFHFKLGYCYLKTDNLDKAKGDFYEVKDKENKYSAPATYYFAHIAFIQKNYETALKHFQKLTRDETFKGIVPYYIARIYSFQGKYDELPGVAIPLLKDDKSKRSAELSRLIGDAYYRTGKYSEAISYLEKYADPKSGTIPPSDAYELAFSYYRTSQYEKAIKYFQAAAASKQDSLSQSAYYHLGDCFVRNNQKTFASNAFLSAYKIGVDKSITEDALFNYAKLSIELSYNPYNEAVKALQKYLTDYPSSLRADEAYGYLTDLYLITKNYKEALASIEKIKSRNGEMNRAYQKIAYYRGIELFNDNDMAGANTMLTKAASDNSDKTISASAIYWIGESYYRQGKFDPAASQYNKFLLSTGAIGLPFFSTANYNLGYCYFKQKNYDKASFAFRKFIADKKADIKLMADAKLRLGDAYYMDKQYAEAIDYYQQAMDASAIDADYSLFQVAMSNGVSGDPNKKITELQKLIKQYPRSSYFDDALYEMGVTYLVLNKEKEALVNFQRIVKDFPKSIFVKRSILKTGLIYFNQDKNELALATLQKVVTDYPGTPESKEALASIRSIYVEMNEVDNFLKYVKDVPFADVSQSEKDSLTYIAAENLYMKGDCDKATPGFNTYISKYKDGAFSINANFYRAECDYKAGRNEQALTGYNYVLQQPRSRFTESAALKAARISYGQANYETAIENYIKLEETAEMPANTSEALCGQMRCNYQLARYGLALQSSQKLLLSEKLPSDLASEAHLTAAKSAQALKNNDLAKKEFEETVKLSQGDAGAEAKYNLASMEFDNADFNSAEKSLLSLSKDYASSDYWVAKGFILLADVYLKKGNAFQAKQTLQSIIENYEGDDLKDLARAKLTAIIQAEPKPSDTKPEPDIE
jgi:TolA-binding protein